MRNLFKERRIKILIISLMLSLGVLFGSKPFISFKKDIQLKMVLKTEKGFDFQVFYTQDPNKHFNEQESFRQKIAGENSFQNIVIPLKDVENLETLRIDFGNNPELVLLKELKISGNRKINIKLKEILNFGKNQIDSSNIENDILKIFSNKIDPYIIVRPDLIKNIPSNNFDFLQSFTLFILLFLMSYKILSYVGNKKENISWNRVVYCLIFFLIILFPVVKISNDTLDKIENRNLASKTKIFKNKTLNINFGKETEAWLNDHFYKRRKVINFYENINKKIIGRVENDRALLGREDWIFYKAENSIQNFQNINLFTEGQLLNIEKSLDDRKNWLEKRGIKYYTFVAPDKNKIYGEFYPNYINKVNEIGKAMQLKNYLESKEKKFIYPFDELINEKKNGLLYWKTDTHWNEHGGYIGYLKLMKEIKKDFPEIEVLKEEDFNISNGAYPGGDLLNMIGLKNTAYLEVQYKQFRLKNSSFTYVKNEGTKGVITKSKKPLKVLIFRDSFTSAMTPYISETFGEVEYIWNHSVNAHQQKIKEYQPDIVIHEMVERYVGVLENNSPKFEGGL